MLAAQADVLVVGPQHHLLALLDDVAALVKAGVAQGFLAAPADGLDLLDHVRRGQQLRRAGEQLPLEVGAQAVADDGDVPVVHQIGEVAHLVPGEELGLVHDDAGAHY